MPNFDGTGPLKRGRIIGRGLGPCKQCIENCTRKAEDREPTARNETAEG
jgi:hypothetical protein